MPVNVENTNVRAMRAHVIDNLASRCLAHDEVVFLVIAVIDGVDERTDAECVVLRGDREARLVTLARIVRLEHVCLLDDLSRIGEELVSLVGKRDAAVGAREDLDTKLAFELLDGNRKVRLRCVHPLSRGAHGAVSAIAMR